MSMPVYSIALSSTATQILLTSANAFQGITIRETAGSAATVKVWDNATTGAGTLLGTYGLAALGSVDRDFAVPRQAKNGITVTVTGTIEGSVFFG